jgi:HPt (histidine-containing phosphotransfer) domain-containing protein
MDDILSKPYTLEACAQVLRRWLRRAGPAADLRPVQPMTQPVPELSGVDAGTVAGLRDLGGTSGDLYSKLVGLFATGSAESLVALELALTRSEPSVAAALCHKFKASAANVGALAFSRELSQMESACEAGNVEAAYRSFARLRSAYPPLLAELASVTLRASA